MLELGIFCQQPEVAKESELPIVGESISGKGILAKISTQQAVRFV